MMGMLTAENFARDLKFHSPPLFEVILPMTDSAKKMIHIQKIFTEFSRVIGKLFGYKNVLDYLSVMPLIENIDESGFRIEE